MYKKSFIIFLSIIFLFSSFAYAFKCGNNLILLGDSKSKVVMKCKKEIISSEIIGTRRIGNSKVFISTLFIEVYYYGSKDYYDLTFHGNKLVEIKKMENQ